MTSRSKRILLIAAAAVVFLIVSWAMIIGLVLTVGGVATVDLHERSEGVRIFVPVPMALVSATAATAGFLSPVDHDELIEVHGDLQLEEWEPFVDALLAGLEECPDVTFVEVVDRGDTVRISKKGGKIRVEVRDPDMSLNVAVPIRPVRRTISGLLR